MSTHAIELLADKLGVTDLDRPQGFAAMDPEIAAAIRRKPRRRRKKG